MTSTTSTKLSRKWFFCRALEHNVRKFCKKKAGNERKDNKGGKRCFRCGAIGHHAKTCPKSSDRNRNNDEQMDLAMVLITPMALSMTAESQKSTRWILYLGFSKHMCNNKSYFIEFTPSEGDVQVGNNKVLTPLGIRTVKLTTVVDGLEHFLTLKNVLYAPDTIHNLISISQARKRAFRVRIDEDPEDSTRRKNVRDS